MASANDLYRGLAVLVKYDAAVRVTCRRTEYDLLFIRPFDEKDGNAIAPGNMGPSDAGNLLSMGWVWNRDGYWEFLIS